MTTAANAGVVVVKDETVVEARAAIETALNVEKSARSRLELVQSRYQRTERTLTYARRMMTRAVDRGKWASSELDVSRRGVAEYRGGLKGEERWEAESRKWGEQSQSVGRELDRWSAELRRIDVESHRSEVKSDPRAYGLLMRSAQHARAMESRARQKKSDADRRAEDSRRRGDDARRENLARNREMVQNEGLMAESASSASEVNQWNTEIRTHEVEVITLSEDSRRLRDEIEKSVQDIGHVRHRLELLNGAADGTPPVQPAQMPLVMTQSALAALKASLDNLEHEPEKVLRLSAAPDGSVTLALGIIENGDRLVSYDESPTLLVAFPLVLPLQGKTIDAVVTPEGTSSIIIS